MKTPLNWHTKMSYPTKRCYHVTLGTKNSWLPGDPRGFRSRNHKVHSSGDHRSPPPPGEHAGLYRYSQQTSGKPIILPLQEREKVACQIVASLDRHNCPLLVISVGGMHVHLLVELPNDRREVKRLLGIAKKSAAQVSSINGGLWAKGCGLKPIRDEAHHRNAFQYIKDHEKEGAFVWTFRDGAFIE